MMDFKLKQNMREIKTQTVALISLKNLSDNRNFERNIFLNSVHLVHDIVLEANQVVV